MGDSSNPEIATVLPSAPQALRPTLSHQVYTLIGFAWPVFGLIFLLLLCLNQWFCWPVPLYWLFVPACLVALGGGHLIALVLESRLITRAFYFFKGGLPLLFYRRFADIGVESITFGDRRILLSAVDALSLTLLGQLEIRSYATSGRVAAADGRASNRADVLARAPLGVLSLADQKMLIDLFRRHRPDIEVNKRLQDRLGSPIVKGQALISAFGAVILAYALFDVSYATFTWLEMLKSYHGSQLVSMAPDRASLFAGDSARQLYEQAEGLRLHPSPFSWAYRALFVNGKSASQMADIRAATLYDLGDKAGAMAILQKAIELKPSGYKTELQLARYLARAGREKEAVALLDAVLEKHKDLLLPRIYNLAMAAPSDRAPSGALYKRYLAVLDEEFFGEEPAWPPGSEKPMMEMWRREDLEFLAKYLLTVKGPGPTVK